MRVWGFIRFSRASVDRLVMAMAMAAISRKAPGLE